MLNNASTVIRTGRQSPRQDGSLRGMQACAPSPRQIKCITQARGGRGKIKPCRIRASPGRLPSTLTVWPNADLTILSSAARDFKNPLSLSS